VTPARSHRKRWTRSGTAGRAVVRMSFSEPRSKGETPMDGNHDRAWSPWYFLLLIQFVPALWVPFYNSVEPKLAGIPFFYWFQMALVLVSAAVTAVVYFATESNRSR
jgi:uncharacterized protein DUF3311